VESAAEAICMVKEGSWMETEVSVLDGKLLMFA
jgi:hypothetical protein